MSARRFASRPVMSREQITELNRRLLSMAATDTVSVFVAHTARTVTRLANGQVLSGDDGDTLSITVEMSNGGADVGHSIVTNQLDDAVLRPLLQQCERLARESVKGLQQSVRVRPKNVQDDPVKVHLWHDSTVRAMTEARETVLNGLLMPVRRSGLNGAGFIGLMARVESYLDRDEASAYNEETDCEVTVTARTPDGARSGWGGECARDWSRIDTNAVVGRAIRMATEAGTVVALEPGRRTAILSPAAVAQLCRVFAGQLEADSTDSGNTGFSRFPFGNKRGERMFDPRVTIRSDPADPDGGYSPFFWRRYGTRAMTWIENGVLKELNYSPKYALVRGKPYTAPAKSIRLSGGPTSIEEMIARCDEGVYVNRFSSVHVTDIKTGSMTGVTRDGCFLVRDGKIQKAVKNFRILESPYFFLNNILAMGTPKRAAFGYSPPKRDEESWPLPPIIVPPLMVRDFNFSALIDAV
jgi:predicted Zn-dependent protease